MRVEEKVCEQTKWKVRARGGRGVQKVKKVGWGGLRVKTKTLTKPTGCGYRRRLEGDQRVFLPSFLSTSLAKVYIRKLFATRTSKKEQTFYKQNKTFANIIRTKNLKQLLFLSVFLWRDMVRKLYYFN